MALTLSILAAVVYYRTVKYEGSKTRTHVIISQTSSPLVTHHWMTCVSCKQNIKERLQIWKITSSLSLLGHTQTAGGAVWMWLLSLTAEVANDGSIQDWRVKINCLRTLLFILYWVGMFFGTYLERDFNANDEVTQFTGLPSQKTCQCARYCIQNGVHLWCQVKVIRTVRNFVFEPGC